MQMAAKNQAVMSAAERMAIVTATAVLGLTQSVSATSGHAKDATIDSINTIGNHRVTQKWHVKLLF